MTDIYTLFPSFKKAMSEFLNKENVFAVYGINPDPNSLSFSVYENLKKEGYKVFAIDTQDEIAGDKIYHDLTSLPEKPDVVCLVTSPEKTMVALTKVLEQGATKIWIDLGSENSEAINYIKEHHINAIYYHSLIKEITNPTEKELEDIGKEIS